LSLRFANLTFEYAGGRRVAQALDVDFIPGEVTVLRGPNGAGKTTLLRLAAGLLRPSAGSVERSGRLVHVPSAIVFHESLTVEEEVRYLAAVGGLELDNAWESLSRWGFEGGLLESEVGSLSTGWRQRLAFALAALPHAELILLDEPFANLDARASDLLTDWLRELVPTSSTAWKGRRFRRLLRGRVRVPGHGMGHPSATRRVHATARALHRGRRSQRGPRHPADDRIGQRGVGDRPTRRLLAPDDRG